MSKAFRKPEELLKLRQKINVYFYQRNIKAEAAVLSVDEGKVVIGFEEKPFKGNIAEGEAVKLEVIIMQTKELIYEAEAEVSKYILLSKPICELINVSTFQKIQRRNYVRMPVQIDVEFALVNYNVKGEGILLDISGGGALLITPQILPLGTELFLNFNLDDANKEPLKIKGKIAREAKISTLQNKYSMPYSYGVLFLDLTVAEQDSIIGYILKKMREKKSFLI